MGFLNYIATANDLEQQISALSLRVVAVATVLLIILVLMAGLFANKKHKNIKTPLFTLIVGIIVSTSLTLFGATIYLNTKSDSGGPVHWHADIEVWACGTQLELRNPSNFLSNKIGTSTLHEHNDQRIHLEGVVVDQESDATIGKFMRVIGGSISNNFMRVPIADNILEDFVDGDVVDLGGASNIDKFIASDAASKKQLEVSDNAICGNGVKGDVQVFVYRFNKQDDTYTQIKLENPENYTIRDESIVPPGDCVIIEFDRTKDKTDKLCEQYGVRDAKRCHEFGVPKDKAELCNIKEVVATGGIK